MSVKLKNFVSKMLAAVLIAASVFPLSSISAVAADTKAGTVMVTDESQLESYFPDAAFRKAVFDAIRDGQDNAEGATIEEAVNNFTGSITANKKGITDIQGIQLLMKAESVSVQKNEIKDYRFLERKVQNAGDTNSLYYGLNISEFQALDRSDGNITWDFGGNPIENVPVNFGGRLVIKDTSAKEYVYPEDMSTHFVYARPYAGGGVSGTMDIAKSKVYDSTAGTSRNAKLVSVYGYNSPGRPLIPGDDLILEINSWDKINYETADFTDVKKSGLTHVSIGVDQELHCWTTDEFDLPTEESVSYKYYLSPTFAVYDRIKASSALGGTASLTKTDEKTGAPVADAVYSIYKKADNSLVMSNLTTDASGKISADGIETGEYYFQETKAPDGYKLNDEKINFKIEGATAGTKPDTKVGGGKAEITTTDGATVKADDHEVLIAGPNNKYGDSPDITLNSDENDEVRYVQVTYSILEQTDGTEAQDVIRSFNNLSEAETDINSEKNANTILGPVSVKALYVDPSVQQFPATVETTDTPLSTTDITVTKTWVDPEDFAGTHPDITVHLWQKIGAAQETDYKTITLKDGETSYTFKDLPAETEDGTTITYTVTEDAAAGYDTSINNTAITNTFQNTEKLTISGEKVWEDLDNALNTRPASITLNLVNTAEPDKILDTQNITPAADGIWKYEFKDLPKYEDNGKLISYKILEDTAGLDDYDSAVSADNKTVTNTLNKSLNEVVSIHLEKLWNDSGSENKRPAAITVSLYSSTSKDKAIQEVTLSKVNNWKSTIEKLPKFTSDGRQIQYSLKENPVKGYKLTEQTTTFDSKTNTFTVQLKNSATAPNVPNTPPKTPITPGTWTSANTGDSITILPYILMGIAAFLAVVVVLYIKRRRK